MALGSLTPFFRGSSPARSGEDDPFRTMRREMERMMDEFGGFGWPGGQREGGLLTPRVNVAETEGGLEVSADLPGLDPKDIELNVADGVLTIKAEHHEEHEKKDEKKTWHVVERRSGQFLRRLPLPFDPDPDGIEATFEKGVLKVTVPRPPEAQRKSRRIEVRGG